MADDYDCGECPEHLRGARGCHGGSSPPWFAGTQYETDTCPRRHLLNNPDLVEAFSLHRACDGKPGVEGLKQLSQQAVTALAIIDDARAEKLEEDMKRAAGEARNGGAK